MGLWPGSFLYLWITSKEGFSSSFNLYIVRFTPFLTLFFRCSTSIQDFFYTFCCPYHQESAYFFDLVKLYLILKPQKSNPYFFSEFGFGQESPVPIRGGDGGHNKIPVEDLGKVRGLKKFWGPGMGIPTSDPTLPHCHPYPQHSNNLLANVIKQKTSNLKYSNMPSHQL